MVVILFFSSMPFRTFVRPLVNIALQGKKGKRATQAILVSWGSKVEEVGLADQDQKAQLVMGVT
jgi:hypothetical protein